MSKVLKSASKILIGILFAVALMINNGTVSAEEVAATEPTQEQILQAQREEGMQAFREALKAYTNESKRIFRHDIFCAMPTAQGEFDFIAKTNGNDLNMSGEFNLWITDDKGNVSDSTIPFYLTQNGKTMDLYFNSDKKHWQRFRAPRLAASLTDMIATPTEEELQETIAITQEVIVLSETDNRRTMLVRLNGNLIADKLKQEAEAENSSENDSVSMNKLTKYFDKALRTADLWYIWTVSKQDWQTITVSYHLTSLVQEVAREALHDPENNLNEIERDLLETIAFYSDTKAYTTFLSDDANKKLEIPKKVLNAPIVKDVTLNPTGK